MKKSHHSLQALAIMAAGLLITQRASAQIETWTGGGANQNWSTVGNWPAGVAPGSATNVVFTNNVGAATVAGDLVVAIASMPLV